MSENKFDVGDRVRVVTTKDVYHGLYGTVVNRLDNSVRYEVGILDTMCNIRRRVYHADELELWQPEPETDTLRRELSDLIAERDALAESRKRLLAIAERAAELFKMLNQPDMLEVVAGVLAQDLSDAGLERYGDWYVMMDREVGLLAQIEQTGMYAEPERPMVDVILNPEGE